ncbi:MAG TPA: NADH:ubiquinone oxidoreductase subunit J, partial [Acidocella sp.]|nr:NADH:ubiquinone oxidoreductase subunit J [Acidocella sp.]
AILLVSMIGAIVLTLRDRNRGKRQNVTMQHERMPADTMRMVNAKLGEGAVMPPQTEEAL